MSDLTPLAALTPHPQWRPAPCPRCEGPSRAVSLTGAAWTTRICDVCLGLDAQAEAAAQARATQAVAAERTAALIRALQVPPLYTDVTLDNFTLHGDAAAHAAQSRVLQLARRYLGTWPDVPMVVICAGAPGTGKGHIVWSLAKAVCALGARARVVKLSDTIRDLRDAWHRPDAASEQSRLASYRSPMFLAIDEVSRHAFYGQPQQHLYDLIDYRTEQARPTVITTNEDRAGLSDLLGGALMSRCLGHGGYWEFSGPDFRLTRGKT